MPNTLKPDHVKSPEDFHYTIQAKSSAKARFLSIDAKQIPRSWMFELAKEMCVLYEELL